MLCTLDIDLILTQKQKEFLLTHADVIYAHRHKTKNSNLKLLKELCKYGLVYDIIKLMAGIIYSLPSETILWIRDNDPNLKTKQELYRERKPICEI